MLAKHLAAHIICVDIVSAFHDILEFFDAGYAKLVQRLSG